MTRSSHVAPPRVVALVGATTGAETTALTAQLGVALAAAGARVATWSPVHTGTDLAAILGIERGDPGSASMGPEGLTLLGNGGRFEAPATHRERRELLDEAEELGRAFELLLLDLGCASDDALFFGAAADDLVLVLAPTPDAVGDAESLLRRLATSWGRAHVHVLPHGAGSDADGLRLIRTLAGSLTDVAPCLLPLDAVGRDADVAALAGVAAAFLGPRPTCLHGGIQFFFADHLMEGRVC
jgi:hypothetical protein